ncbi:MAG: TIGR03790 family protein [Pseudomonadota bacterium]
MDIDGRKTWGLFQAARTICIVLFLGFLSGNASALDPEQVLVVANRNAPHSVQIADFYMTLRQIPRSNLLVLWSPDNEVISRSDYGKYIATPVNSFLETKDPFEKIRCIVTAYGIPLTIAGDPGGDGKRPGTGASSSEASVDSELSLVKVKDHLTDGWIPNPCFLGNTGRKGLLDTRVVLMVSRIDGPSPDCVKRFLIDGVRCEKKGLNGTAYFDARWPMPAEGKETDGAGYGFYDRSIHLASRAVDRSRVMPVVLDDNSALFQKGDCPEAALYCGWYSLESYVDAFAWQPGAVGYHIASGECNTLRNPAGNAWCKRMLEKGVAATLGPVGEPYVQAFPLPELFFGLLVEGRLTLAEVFMASCPFLSWKMVLVGDPLYRPFKCLANGSCSLGQ